MILHCCSVLHVLRLILVLVSDSIRSRNLAPSRRVSMSSPADVFAGNVFRHGVGKEVLVHVVC